MKIRSDIEVTCFTYEGIDAIKDALMAGEASGSVETPIKIKLIAPPLYVMTTTTLDKDQGVEQLSKAIDVISNIIVSKGYGTTAAGYGVTSVVGDRWTSRWLPRQ